MLLCNARGPATRLTFKACLQLMPSHVLWATRARRLCIVALCLSACPVQVKTEVKADDDAPSAAHNALPDAPRPRSRKAAAAAAPAPDAVKLEADTAGVAAAAEAPLQVRDDNGATAPAHAIDVEADADLDAAAVDTDAAAAAGVNGARGPERSRGARAGSGRDEQTRYAACSTRIHHALQALICTLMWRLSTKMYLQCPCVTLMTRCCHTVTHWQRKEGSTHCRLLHHACTSVRLPVQGPAAREAWQSCGV